MTDELRAKFEAWASSHKLSLLRDGVVVDYAYYVTDMAWNAWQAAHASRDAEVEALRAARDEAKDGWHQANGVADLAMKHRDAAENETEELKKDAERINWLALHPRGAKIVIAGAPQNCIFWGISSAPNNTLREAIDTAMREDRK